MLNPLEVEVAGDIERAFKNLKKKMAFEGIFKELKRRRYYEKPSEEKKRKKEEAERRRLKKMRRFTSQVKGRKFVNVKVVSREGTDEQDK
jgi:small subunit ribosomal protein S21